MASAGSAEKQARIKMGKDHQRARDNFRKDFHHQTPAPSIASFAKLCSGTTITAAATTTHFLA